MKEGQQLEWLFAAPRWVMKENKSRNAKSQKTSGFTISIVYCFSFIVRANASCRSHVANTLTLPFLPRIIVLLAMYITIIVGAHCFG
jgi:hypothetical protein